MARKRTGEAKKHGTRAKPMLRKATKTLSGKTRKSRNKARQHYIRNRRKILTRAKQYYRKHRAKILRKAKMYRRKLRTGKAPLYKHSGIGGRYPRYKRLARLNKYKWVAGKPKRKGGHRKRK